MIVAQPQKTAEGWPTLEPERDFSASVSGRQALDKRGRLLMIKGKGASELKVLNSLTGQSRLSAFSKNKLSEVDFRNTSKIRSCDASAHLNFSRQ